MSAAKIIGIVLIVAGALALGLGGFSYNEEKEAVKLGSFSVTMQQQKRIDIPMWAGIAAIVAGGLMLLVSKK